MKQSIKGLKNYKQVKVQWTEQLVAKQQKVTEEIKRDRAEDPRDDARDKDGGSRSKTCTEISESKRQRTASQPSGRLPEDAGLPMHEG